MQSRLLVAHLGNVNRPRPWIFDYQSSLLRRTFTFYRTFRITSTQLARASRQQPPCSKDVASTSLMLEISHLNVTDFGAGLLSHGHENVFRRLPKPSEHLHVPMPADSAGHEDPEMISASVRKTNIHPAPSRQAQVRHWPERNNRGRFTFQRVDQSNPQRKLPSKFESEIIRLELLDVNMPSSNSRTVPALPDVTQAMKARMHDMREKHKASLNIDTSASTMRTDQALEKAAEAVNTRIKDTKILQEPRREHLNLHLEQIDSQSMDGDVVTLNARIVQRPKFTAMGAFLILRQRGGYILGFLPYTVSSSNPLPGVPSLAVAEAVPELEANFQSKCEVTVKGFLSRQLAPSNSLRRRYFNSISILDTGIEILELTPGKEPTVKARENGLTMIRPVRRLTKFSKRERNGTTVTERWRRRISQPDILSLKASILNAASAESAGKLFLSSECEKPQSLLNDVLRHKEISAWTFRRLLIYSWENYVTLPLNSQKTQPLAGTAVVLNEFIVMVYRLLRHARKVSPPAIVSLAHMTVQNCQQLAANTSPTGTKIDPELHAKLSSIYNSILMHFRLPASITPFKSMRYNWEAQRTVLESASKFVPPLDLNKNSYRAVCLVLLALRKSPQEAEFSGLLERSWPPWRREQDGTEVDRSKQDDLSRVNMAVARMEEAGYNKESLDRVIEILGGRDDDGTPTIQTRYLLQMRYKTEGKLQEGLKQYPTSQPAGPKAEWAAKIEATRDVQEAWSAFSSFPKEAGPRSLSMYFAMLKKLVYNDKLVVAGRPTNLLPGDGLEVFPVDDGNLSGYSKVRLTPPGVDELYESMIKDGIRPQGRCLDFLVSHARITTRVVQYLQDSDLQPSLVAKLIDPTPGNPYDITIEKVPQATFVAFIEFLCRLGQKSRRASTWSNFSALENDPFRHALWLLHGRQHVCRPAWNALFRGLAREGATLNSDRDLIWNGKASWVHLQAVYHKSQELGLELDCDGFQYMCRGLEKAIYAELESAYQGGEVPALHEVDAIQQGVQLLKNEFQKLGYASTEEFYLPKLVMGLGGTHLHAYVRVIGLMRDTEELRHIADWMVEQQNHLVQEAHESASGWTQLRRAVIAIRAFADQALDEKPDTVTGIASQVEQLVEWGGWPSDSEVKNYQERWIELEEWKDMYPYYLEAMREKMRETWIEDADEDES